MKQYFSFTLVLVTLFLISCSTPTVSQKQQPDLKAKTQLNAIALDRKKIVAGQTVYVPVYSYIYHFNSQNHVMNLSTTLSIRNTDLTNSIIISAVRYYDNDGQLIREYIQHPVGLKALASTDFFIEADDVSGGLGANFIVEWVAEKAVFDPIVEAVMISTASSQGISFTSSGRVLKRYGVKK